MPEGSGSDLGLDGDAYHRKSLAAPLGSGGEGSVLCGRKLSQQPAGPRRREEFRRHGEGEGGDCWRGEVERRLADRVGETFCGRTANQRAQITPACGTLHSALDSTFALRGSTSLDKHIIMASIAYQNVCLQLFLQVRWGHRYRARTLSCAPDAIRPIFTN